MVSPGTALRRDWEQMALQRMFLCVSFTPFESPVVPEVYEKIYGSSVDGSMKGGAFPSPAWVTCEKV